MPEGRSDILGAMSFPAASPIRLPARSGAAPVTLSTHQLGAGPAVVFCHGFPDLAYGWHNQLTASRGSGVPRYRARPTRLWRKQRARSRSTRTGLTELTGDLVGLLDALDIERAYLRRPRLGRLRGLGHARAAS